MTEQKDPQKRPDTLLPHELFSTSNLQIALQTRLLLGGEALKADKKDLPKIDAGQLTGIKEPTYNLLKNTSTNERADYWRQKAVADQSLSSFDNQYSAWQQGVMDFVNNSKDANLKQTLTKLSAMGIDWNNFNDQQADKIYQRYFRSQPSFAEASEVKPGTASNIQVFISDIIQSYHEDYQALKTDLPTIKKLANIFGGNSSEILEAAINAEFKIRNDQTKQELVDQSNETKTIANSPTLRLNWLNKDEERLLEWLSGKQPTIVKITPPIQPKPPEPRPRSEPIRVTPEQNLQTAQFFCNNLREKLKDGNRQPHHDRLQFTDPTSGIYIYAQNKENINSQFFTSNTFIDWANKYGLPIVVWNQQDFFHFTLLLKGPEKQPDGKYKILIYNPFHDTEDYEELPIHEDFETYKRRELPKLKYNPSLKRYELRDRAYVPEDRVERYLYTQWFQLPPHRSYQASDIAYDQLTSKTNPYNLSIHDDFALPWELKVGKGQRFQFNGYDCGPLSFYSAVLRYAALPGNEEGKQRLVETFADHFGVRILTRKEILGK